MWIECLDPRRVETGDDSGAFCGRRSMFDARGFVPAEEHDRYDVVRRPV
jgi:hypothetical protein